MPLNNGTVYKEEGGRVWLRVSLALPPRGDSHYMYNYMGIQLHVPLNNGTVYKEESGRVRVRVSLGLSPRGYSHYMYTLYIYLFYRCMCICHLTWYAFRFSHYVLLQFNCGVGLFLPLKKA